MRKGAEEKMICAGVDAGSRTIKIILMNSENLSVRASGIMDQGVSTMVGRGVAVPVIFTGGVALIPGMDKALESVLERPVSIAPEPQMTGALGAAILACREHNRDRK